MRSITIILLTILAVTSCTTQKQTAFAREALEHCFSKTRLTLTHLKSERDFDYSMMPRNIEANGTVWNLRKATKEEWTAGFWPGILWYMYEFSGDNEIRKEAENFTDQLAFISRTPAYDHDLGFQVFCSYGNAFRLTGKAVYKQIILSTADSLATLFNPRVGTILSWPREVIP